MFSKILIAIIMVIFAILFFLFFWKKTVSEKNNMLSNDILQNISIEEANYLILENKNNPNFIILDVRTSEEYGSSRIENSINIDFYQSDFKEQLSRLDKNKIYLVYCHSGNRSGQAVKIMESLEFKKVYNMLGGIVEWKNNNFPVIK